MLMKACPPSWATRPVAARTVNRSSSSIAFAVCLPVFAAVLARPSLGLVTVWVGLLLWVSVRAVKNHTRVRGEAWMASADRVANAGGTPSEQLQMLGDELVGIIAKYPDHVWVFLHEFPALTGEWAEQFRRRRREYEQRWNEQFRSGGHMDLVHCYRSFMERLTHALEQQQRIVQQAAQHMEQARAQLQEHELRVASVRKLIERRHRDNSAPLAPKRLRQRGVCLSETTEYGRRSER